MKEEITCIQQVKGEMACLQMCIFNFSLLFIFLFFLSLSKVKKSMFVLCAAIRKFSTRSLVLTAVNDAD